MSPQPRRQSTSGYYHVVQKGNGGQVLFFSHRDFKYYLTVMQDALQRYDLFLHAFCLMSNHTHLIVEGEIGALSQGMKWIGQGYAYHFKETTGQIGHVFSSRYWSEPIETDSYLLNAVRYVHRNPEPPHVAKASEYPWSSYMNYVSVDSGYVTTDTVMGLFGSREAFVSFHEEGAPDVLAFPGSKLYNHLSDEELVTIATELLGGMSPLEIKNYTIKRRSTFINLLFNSGYSVRQIVRITGLGVTQVQRARQTVYG